MDDYRTMYATPGQVDSVWSVIYALRQQVEELTQRLSRMETGGAIEGVGLSPDVAEAAVEMPQG